MMNENEIIRTRGFGVPDTIDPHHFIVNIPFDKKSDIIISENFGVSAVTDNFDVVIRCRLLRKLWVQIAEEVRFTFNGRLKEKSLQVSKWTTGENMVERLLGKELCVLAWAIEVIHPDLCPKALKSWINLKPEERWWLFKMVDQSSKEIDPSLLEEYNDEKDKGWKKALRIAFTESSPSKNGIIKEKKTIKDAQYKNVDLFEGEYFS